MERTAKRTPQAALRLLLSIALAFGLVPAQALAAEDGSDGGQSIEAEADSWRYSEGTTIEHPLTDSSSGLLPLSSSYSIWKKSYGTSYLGIVSGDETTEVEISGVERVGIDVSKWQADIDWEKVAAAGIDFAIIRCGYGSDKSSQDDAYFIQNVEGALDAGIEIGVYLYSYATSTSEAKSEAEHALRMLEEAGLDPSDLDLPVFLDMEDSDQAEVGTSTLGKIAQTFCDAIEDEGWTAGIYANKNWWENYLTDDAFSENDWYKWVARYPASTSITSTGVDDTDIWQFTSSGTVPGIDGNVDVDFDYRGEGYYVEASDGLYRDVKDSSKYYYEAVYALRDADYLKGYTNGYFGVGAKMSRAEFVTLLWRIACPEEYAAYDQDAAKNTSGLSDVADGTFYTAAVDWAVEEGVVTGYESGEFEPNESISFEQMCLVIARYEEFDYWTQDHMDAAAEFIEDFTDASEVSDYALEGVSWCVDQGIVEGYTDGTLRPGSEVTRERVAVIIWRAIEADML